MVKKDNPYFLRNIIRYGGSVYTVLYALILLIFISTWYGSYHPYIEIWEVILILVGGAVCLALDRHVGGILWRLGTLVRRTKKCLLILFGLFATISVIVHLVDFHPIGVWMQQWQLPCGLILLGVITAVIYLWWGSDTLSPKQSGSSTFGGFLSGMFLALGLSLCYHYRFLEDPYSLGWLLLLWIVLSGGLWHLKTRQRAMNQTSIQVQRKRRHFQLSPRFVRLNGKALVQVSLVVGLVVSMVSWIRSLVPGSPFYQATGSLYQAARALPYLQSPDLLVAVLTVNSFIVTALIPALVNPWPAFFV